MAHTYRSTDTQKIRQLVEAAYHSASDGASIDVVLGSDAKRSEFDFYVQSLADYLEVAVTPEQGRRTLLALRQAGLLRSPGATRL